MFDLSDSPVTFEVVVPNNFHEVGLEAVGEDVPTLPLSRYTGSVAAIAFSFTPNEVGSQDWESCSNSLKEV